MNIVKVWIYMLITSIMVSIIALYEWWIYIFIFYCIMSFPVFMVLNNYVDTVDEKNNH